MNTRNKKDRKKIWIIAGRDQFAKHGLKGINIDHLSKMVGISRTSFYHFFGNKKQFLNGLVEFWVQDGTMRVINAAGEVKKPKERLRRIYDLALHNYINDQFLSQMRNAALNDRYLKQKLEEVEQLRVRTVTHLFLDFGFDRKVAGERALLVYLIYLGFLEHFKTSNYPESAVQKTAEATLLLFFKK